MRMVGVVISFFLVVITTGCKYKADKQADDNVDDSTQIVKDSVVNREDLAFENCYENFFTELPKFKDSNSAFLLLKNGKKLTLTQFFRNEYMSPVSQYGRKDLDGDGIMELIIYNNTGGAHCCDEYYIFKQNNNDVFDFGAHIVSGQACIDAKTNIFTYSFSETLGYFFACYACGFQDSSGAFKIMREMRLQYRDSKLEIIPYDSTEEKQNLRNLDILQRHGFEKVEGLMDNGWRKEFAMNFAVWHYNHGKNWKSTKKLFDKYYNFKDAVKVWNEFYNILRDTEKENSFMTLSRI